MLDDYRRSFSFVYEKVLEALGTDLGFAPTGRPSKSTISIIDKLGRESIRLSQMQDIAGCRVTVQGISEQEAAVDAIKSIFEKVSVIDRREKPSHGYRAVHLVAKPDGKSIEIQIRTELQHLWAELVEKASDHFGMELKYGIGDEEALMRLSNLSELIALAENVEAGLVVTERTKTELPAVYQQAHENNLRNYSEIKKRLGNDLRELIDLLRRFS